MKVHIGYKIRKTLAIEKEVSRQIEKIQKRLQLFRPELVHLKVLVERDSARAETCVSLNLRIPSGQLAARAQAPVAAAAIKTTFDELIRQIGRHKELLRSSHKWRHWRGGVREARNPGVPFERTLAVISPRAVSPADISSYVNANLSRLERFVDRELYFRRAAEEFLEGALSASEVVDEVIARALGEHDRPEQLSLEPWLYQLALQAMNDMTLRLRELDSPAHLHLEDSRRRQNVLASDEPGLQFHQPDEDWTRESGIADQRVSTPEQNAYCDELVALVHAALGSAERGDREAFLLFGIEGFSIEEIAAITGRSRVAVLESVRRARVRLRALPAIAKEFNVRKLRRSGT
jgi:DNA-directed RNA polymerase specialized sigma24 family protein/ribosome-associated translation inhibitor RaiA